MRKSFWRDKRESHFDEGAEKSLWLFLLRDGEYVTTFPLRDSNFFSAARLMGSRMGRSEKASHECLNVMKHMQVPVLVNIRARKRD